MIQAKREWLTLALILLFAGAFIFITASVYAGAFNALDAGTLATLKTIRSPGLDHFFLELTALGSLTVLTMLSISVTLFLLLEGRRRDALQLILAAALTSGLNQSLKLLAARARPPIADRLELAAGFSFPSGHSSSGAAIYLTFTLLLLPHLRTKSCVHLLSIAPVLILLIGFSRAYLAVHYPTDIIAGLCLGTGMALLLDLFLNRRSAWSIRR